MALDERAQLVTGHPQLEPEEDGDSPFVSRRGSRRERRSLRLASAARADRGAQVLGVVLTVVALVGMTVWVIWQIRPDLIFGPAMDVGGDNGGHVAAPYFLIHQLLPHGRIEGWDPQWFDGFPLYVFYFPLPALLIALLNLVFPYAVAFKVVTVLGTITLPVAAWAFGRLAGFRRPVPVLMAAAMLPYLFNTSYTIDGGNLTSTLAGEFSFSLALSTGMLFLGVFAYALQNGPAPVAGGGPVRRDGSVPRRAGARLRGHRRAHGAQPDAAENGPRARTRWRRRRAACRLLASPIRGQPAVQLVDGLSEDPRHRRQPRPDRLHLHGRAGGSRRGHRPPEKRSLRHRHRRRRCRGGRRLRQTAVWPRLQRPMAAFLVPFRLARGGFRRR